MRIQKCLFRIVTSYYVFFYNTTLNTCVRLVNVLEYASTDSTFLSNRLAKFVGRCLLIRASCNAIATEVYRQISRQLLPMAFAQDTRRRG